MVVLIHTNISRLTLISRLIHIRMIIFMDISRHIYHVIGRARYVGRLSSMDTRQVHSHPYWQLLILISPVVFWRENR